MKKLLIFLERLDEANIYYRLNKVRDTIMVEISVPGERWEVEYMLDGTIEVERFISTGDINDEHSLEYLFERFSD